MAAKPIEAPPRSRVLDHRTGAERTDTPKRTARFRRVPNSEAFRAAIRQRASAPFQIAAQTSARLRVIGGWIRARFR